MKAVVWAANNDGRASTHLGAVLRGARCADRRLDLLPLLGRRQNGLQAESVHPELARPASRMVEVLILLVFNLGISILQRLSFGAGDFLRRFPDQLPVQVILELR